MTPRPAPLRPNLDTCSTAYVPAQFLTLALPTASRRPTRSIPWRPARATTSALRQAPPWVFHLATHPVANHWRTRRGQSRPIPPANRDGVRLTARVAGVLAGMPVASVVLQTSPLFLVSNARSQHVVCTLCTCKGPPWFGPLSSSRGRKQPPSPHGEDKTAVSERNKRSR